MMNARSLPALLIAGTLLGCTDQPFTIDVPLRVVGVEPSGDGVGVGRDDLVIRIHFSEQLAADSIADGFTLEAVGGEIGSLEQPLPVAATATYAGGEQNTVVVTPARRLDYSTDYRLTIATTVLRDRDEGPLPIEVTSSFSTEDPQPLRVVSTTPGNGSLGVELDATLAVTFSEPPDCTSLNAGTTVTEAIDAHPRFTAVSGGVVSGTWTCPTPSFAPGDATADVACDGGACVATFAPTDGTFAFQYSSHVTITLQGGTRSDGAIESSRATARGGQLAETVTIEFDITDPPTLAVLAIEPPGGAVGGALDGGVAVTFSEGIFCASLAGVTMTETLDSHPHYGGATVTKTLLTDGCSDGDAVVTFVPTVAFSRSSVVTLTLPGGGYPDAIESIRATTLGGQLTETVMTSFRAEDPPPLAVISAAPSPGAIGVAVDTDVVVAFSESLDCASVEATSVAVIETPTDDPTNPITHTCSLACTGNQIRCDTAFDFGLTSSVEVIIDGAIESARASSFGGQLGQTFSFTFATIHPPPLVIVATQPGSGADNILPSTLIEVTFNEAPDCSSITPASFQIETCDPITACDEPGDFTTLTATDGVWTCNTDDPVVTFDATPDFDFDDIIRVTLSESIRSARATSLGGTLAAGVVYTYEIIALPPIEVVSVFPADEAEQVPTNTEIQVVFNLDILPDTLCTTEEVPPSTWCAADSPNVWLWVEGSTDIADRVPIALIDYATTTRTATFAPPTDITGGLRYEVVIRGGSNGVRTPQGAQLLTNYRWQFDVGVSAYIEDVTPFVDADSVMVSTPICINFLGDVDAGTVDSSTFHVDFIDPFGRQIALPAAGYTYPSPDVACLLADPTLFDCMNDVRTLLYDTVYTVTLEGGVQLADSTAVPGFSWSFVTGLPPAVGEISATNALVDIPVLAGADEVPITSSFMVTFSVPMDPGWLDDTTIVLEDSGGTSVPGTVTLSTDGTLATFIPAGLLGYDEMHSLTVTSGLSGVRTMNNEWLDEDVAVSFTTSPATTVAFSPAQGDPAIESAVVVAVFSRPLHLPSVTETDFYADDISGTPTRLTANVAINTADPDSAILVPLPGFRAGSTVEVTVDTGIWDYRGNPLPSPSSVTYGPVESAPALNARDPSELFIANLSPNAGLVAGGQIFTLSFPTSTENKQENRMLPSTFNDSTIQIWDRTGCDGRSADTLVGQTNTFLPGGNNGFDRVQFSMDGFIRSGCTYEIQLVQAGFSNIHFATNAAGDLTVQVSGETTAPLLPSIVPAAGAVAPEAMWMLTFNEHIDPDSVDETTVYLEWDDGGTPTTVDAMLAVDGAMVHLRPTMPLESANAPYTLHVDAVTDLAGNAFAGTTAVYTVDTLQVLSHTAPASATDPVVVTFNQAVDPSTLTFDTSMADGTVRVRDTNSGAMVYGCISLDDTGTVVTFEPVVGGLTPGTDYTLTITTGVADVSGAPLATEYSATFTAP